jgi:hypothetical protein
VIFSAGPASDRARWWRRGSSLATAGVVGAVFFLFFWPATLRGQFLILRDSWIYSYPLRSAAWRQIQDGQLPLWTTGIFSGYPLLSMSQLGLGYPLTWAYFFHGGWGEQVFVLAPFVLAPSFTYLYVRELGRSRSSALLAGLAFAYGGFNASPIGHSGILSNGFAWLPLMLVWVERSRRGRFFPCLVATALSYAACVLAGSGQAFVTVALVAGAYGAFAFVVPATPLPWRSFDRARPGLVAGFGMLLGAGLSAFQVLETLSANALSVRRKLTYEAFIQGSATIENAFASVFVPLNVQVGDVTSYVPPLALILATVAAVLAIRSKKARDPRLLFWFAACVAAFILMCGGATPVYRLVYHVPLLNLFRVPARHAAEWTLAIAVVSAYGWDAVRERLLAKRHASRDRLRTLLACIALLVAATIAVQWNTTGRKPEVSDYLVSKAALTLVLLAGAILSLLLSRSGLRRALSYAIIVLATVTEGYLCISRWWFPFSKTAAQLNQASPTTEYLRRFPAQQNRVYSPIVGFGEEDLPRRPADAPNNTGWLGLDDVAGYEPMILARYSEALGNADIYGISRGTKAGAAYGGPFHPRSQVLDLLNTSFVVRRLQAGEAIVPGEWERAEPMSRLVIDFGEPAARRVLVRGWSGDEKLGGNTGSWSEGRESLIRAEMLPSSDDYELLFGASAFGPIAPLQMIIRINGDNIARLRIAGARQEYSTKIKGGQLREGLNEIAFTYARTMAPANQGGGSRDSRKLGIFVDFFALTPVE